MRGDGEDSVWCLFRNECCVRGGYICNPEIKGLNHTLSCEKLPIKVLLMCPPVMEHHMILRLEERIQEALIVGSCCILQQAEGKSLSDHTDGLEQLLRQVNETFAMAHLT